jgi:integrase/recombinase XerC
MATPKVNLTAAKNKNGTVYRIDYTVNGKRVRQRVGSNKYNAELIRAEIENKLLFEPHNISVLKPKAIDLRKLIEESASAKKHYVRKSTQLRYRSYFTRFEEFVRISFPAAWADVRTIDESYIREYINVTLEPTDPKLKPWTRRTLNDSLKNIKSLFNYGIKRGYLEKNPADEIKPVRTSTHTRAGCFEDEHLTNIWMAVDQHWKDPLSFITHTGLRKAELINLHWESVSLTDGREQIVVESYDDWETKTGKSRTIPLNAEAIAILKRQLGKNPEYVFTSKEGKKIHPDKIYHAFKKALEQLNLQGDVHKLRHTFANRLIRKGADLNTVKDLLGHADLQTTQIYLHSNPTMMRDAVDRLLQ